VHKLIAVGQQNAWPAANITIRTYLISLFFILKVHLLFDEHCVPFISVSNI
jgi:hypothetical protein